MDEVQSARCCPDAAAALTAAALTTGAFGGGEACGVLGGELRSGRATVHRWQQLPNRSADPHRFCVDPLDFLRAEADLRRRGLRWLGFGHSHPAGPPVPSPADLRELWRGCLHLIAGRAADGSSSLRAFVLTSQGARSLPLEGWPC